MVFTKLKVKEMTNVSKVFLSIVLLIFQFHLLNGQNLSEDTIYIYINRADNDMIEFVERKSHPEILEKDPSAKNYSYKIKIEKPNVYSFGFSHVKYPTDYLQSVDRLDLEVHIYEKDSAFLKTASPLSYDFFINNSIGEVVRLSRGSTDQPPKIFIIDKADIKNGKIKLVQVIFYPETRE